MRTEEKVEVGEHVVPAGGRLFADQVLQRAHAPPLTALVDRVQNERDHSLQIYARHDQPTGAHDVTPA